MRITLMPLPKNFYFSVSFNPHSDRPVEFFPIWQGMVQVHALSQMWEKGYKTIPCARCDGLGIAYCCDGEDASCDAVTLFSDQSKTIEDTSLVT